MAKFYGAIGYGEPVEIRPGVYQPQITERIYSGDVIRNTTPRSNSQESTNDDLKFSNQISIIADPYAYQNYHLMKYVEIMGTKWKITNVEPRYPRLILSVGGVYNGK
jgi:hypothetical protein